MISHVVMYLSGPTRSLLSPHSNTSEPVLGWHAIYTIRRCCWCWVGGSNRRQIPFLDS